MLYVEEDILFRSRKEVLPSLLKWTNPLSAVYLYTFWNTSKYLTGPRSCALQTQRTPGLSSISLIIWDAKDFQVRSQAVGFVSQWEELAMENLSTLEPMAIRLLQAKEEGTGKIIVCLLSQSVFCIHLRKSLIFFFFLSLKHCNWLFEPLTEHRMWSASPFPLAVEILLIRIRISRFSANLELERVIWGRRMQNKMLNDSLPFNKGGQAQPL